MIVAEHFGSWIRQNSGRSVGARLRSGSRARQSSVASSLAIACFPPKSGDSGYGGRPKSGDSGYGVVAGLARARSRHLWRLLVFPPKSGDSGYGGRKRPKSGDSGYGVVAGLARARSRHLWRLLVFPPKSGDSGYGEEDRSLATPATGEENDRSLATPATGEENDRSLWLRSFGLRAATNARKGDPCVRSGSWRMGGSAARRFLRPTFRRRRPCSSFEIRVCDPGRWAGVQPRIPAS